MSIRRSSRVQGVSVAVGSTLLVAIVVILAVVIGTFVYGLGADTNQTATASVSFDETEGESVTVRLTSVQVADHIFVKPQYGKLPGQDGAYLTSGGVHNDGYPDGPTYGDGSSAQHYLLSGNNGGVGTTVTMTTSSARDGTLTVIGVVDGSETVLTTYDYTGGR